MIRSADISDIQAIRSIAEVVFRRTYSSILSPSQIEYMMDMMYSERSLRRQMEELGHVFLMEEGRGYVSFRRDGKTDDGIHVFHLEKLYVMPDCQKSGLGRKLFDAVVREVDGMEKGQKRIELNVNRSNPAVGFYEHLGMRRDRQGDFPIGNGFYMNDYIMALDIDITD